MNSGFLLALMPFLTHASEQVAAVSQKGDLASFAVALAIGLAATGGTIAQGRAASSALEGLSRNPSAKDSVFVPMLLALALIESLVIFTWAFAFLKY